ncbi:MAG: hypothetical protein ABIR18_09845 [Chitinophagaceae bacterium]
MKYRIVWALLFTITCFQSAAQKKIEFTYPEDALADSSKKAFVKDFNQGHALYLVTCAKCHNMSEGKKEIIPDFSLPQLMDYEMRLYPQHADRIGDDTKMTDVELQKIIVFLRYKQKSGRTITPPPKL